jgi:hypothetical protein
MRRPFRILEPFASFEEERCFLAGLCILSLVCRCCYYGGRWLMVDLAKLRLRMIKMLRRASLFAPGCICEPGKRRLDNGDLELFDFAPDLFFALAKPLL